MLLLVLHRRCHVILSHNMQLGKKKLGVATNFCTQWSFLPKKVRLIKFIRENFEWKILIHLTTPDEVPIQKTNSCVKKKAYP